MKPNSVSPTAYLNDYLGINVTSTTPNQTSRPDPSSGKLKSEIQDGNQAKGLSAIDYLEKIYDVVVGFNHDDATSFAPDPALNQAKRFGAKEIEIVIGHASEIMKRYGPTQFEHQVFNQIIFVARKYQDFLEGRTEKLDKDPKAGIRHTLVRGNRGRMFEMLNSMTEKEQQRCSEKTSGLISAVENPLETGTPFNGRPTSKIELGRGGFGRTRIAREFDKNGSSRYVAAKKTHPKLGPSMSKGMVAREIKKSNFYNLPVAKQTQLQDISHAIITPYDDCSLHSTKSAQINASANEFNAYRSIAGDDDAAIDIEGVKAAIFNHLKMDEQQQFIAKKRSNSFVSQHQSAKSHYTFSELGITTLEAMIEKLNVARFAFEGSYKTARLLPQAEVLHREYAQTFYGAVPPNPPAAEIHAHILDPKFMLKDSVYTDKFLNTLGKKTLAAVAELHKTGLAHHDIKPDNIVITKDKNKVISAKLIDIDLLRSAGPAASKEEIHGFVPFRPPESSIPERDSSFSYTGIGGDAYAMGLTLRKMAGFGYKEIFELSEQLKSESENARLKEYIKDAKIQNTEMNEFSDNLDKRLRTTPLLPDDNRLQSRIFLDAKDATIPDATTLKDIADRMLNEVDKRMTPTQALKHPLFNDKNGTVLSEPEFSDYAKRILRYGVVTPKLEVERYNDYIENDECPVLPLLRHVARQSAAMRRGHLLPDENFDGLSAAEREQIESREKILQRKAAAGRTGRAINAGLRNGMANLGLVQRRSIAEQKNNFKK